MVDKKAVSEEAVSQRDKHMRKSILTWFHHDERATPHPQF
jgi:hypothetical protein